MNRRERKTKRGFRLSFRFPAPEFCFSWRKKEMEAVISDERVATYRTAADVARLVHEFENCRLERAEWTHQAHLVVALWYLLRHDEAKAVRLIRESIRRYNEAGGVKQTRTGGYHETITLFYIRIIRRFLSAASPDCTLMMLVKSVINNCGDKNLPFEYYSRERLLSWEARTEWCEPDLKALE
jgi:hypothetical protein